MEVLVPVDGSEPSARALRFAVEFAERYDASLAVVHVSDAETAATETVLERARAVLAEAERDVSPELVTVDLTTRTADEIGDVIVELAAERDADHVVMGHHGRGRVESAFLGSAAQRVLRDTDRPVTVVP